MLIALNYVTDESETTLPVIVDTSQVRYFHPRKYGRPGTRLSFHNGSGLVVSDSFERIQELIGLSPVVPHAPTAPTGMVASVDENEVGEDL